MKKTNITLVKGWKYWWREWSTWLVVIGTSLLSFTPELAEAINYVWLNIPMDIKTVLPEEWIRWFGLALTAISIPAKLVNQRKLVARRERDESEERGGRIIATIIETED